MNERLFQFIWQFQYFNKNNLVTSKGDEITILSVGNYNTDQGPDFLNGRVKVGREILAGNIELHLKTSDWNLHRHNADPRYNNVILHVVYENDIELKHAVPTLELSGRISNMMLAQYRQLMQHNYFIPCGQSLNTVPALTLLAWKDSLIGQRLEEKSAWIISLLQQTNRHWEEVFWWLIARNFGMATNTDAFFQLGKSIPLRAIARCHSQIHQLEAILFGQAGLLSPNFKDDYMVLLKKEYDYLSKKFSLTPPLIQLNFLRMRPANFPTIRLAQLAMLLYQSHHLFSYIMETSSLVSVLEKFEVQANDYWHYHYVPDELSSYKIKRLGKQTIQNILINTVIPVLFAYGNIQRDEGLKNKAISWLELLPPEKNLITSGFSKLGVDIKNAFDSQAYIYLKKQFCTSRHCLNCSIGNAILKRCDQPQL